MSKKAKKAVRMILSVLLSVILSVQVTVSVFAAEGENEVEPRLITNQTLSVPNFEQEKTNWCWVACAVSVMHFIRSTSITQSAFCYDAIGSYANVRGTNEDIKNGLSSHNIGCIIRHNKGDIDDYFEGTITVGYVMTMQEIRTQITAGKPIIALCRVNGNGHYRIICGHYYDDVTNTSRITYMDPGIGLGVIGVGDFYTVDYDDFCYVDENNFWVSAVYNFT